MNCNKEQPWLRHFTAQPGNPELVNYQEKTGDQIIADGGSAGPPVDESAPVAKKDSSIGAANRLCPHLGPITNPTLKKD